MWEVYVWKWLMKIDDRWAPHILIGPKDVDFFHPVKLAVIEIDGEYWHSTRQATDLILRKAIESMGVKVRVLRAASFEQLKRGLPGWYGMNF